MITYLLRAGVLLGIAALLAAVQPTGAAPKLDEALAKDWLARWEKNIVADERNRYCDKEMGEEIGWLVSPFEFGFYYGYLATGDTQWLDRLVDWGDSWIKSGVKEPDGYLGWPKAAGASTGAMPDFTTDNILGEAMGLRPLALMAGTVRKTPALKAKYGAKAESYLKLAEQTFEKWDKRGCWREVKDGGVWVVAPFGLDPKTGRFTEGYARRATDGFTLPCNKQNHIAMWLIALYDATKKPLYRERAEKWWKVQKSRMRVQQEGKYAVWNYWEPAGPWDNKPEGGLKHWVGVHPNGGYYSIDLEGIVAAYEHKLVFTRDDINRLIRTNRDLMWNHQVQGAKFGRIDGEEPDPRWPSGGSLWTALVPYDETLRKVFEANHNPAGWGGLAATPWYVARMAGKLGGP